jgi:hypothetical protein
MRPSPTNEDGTVDHMLFVTKAGSGSTCTVLSSETVVDPEAAFSDHCMLTAAVLVT